MRRLFLVFAAALALGLSGAVDAQQASGRSILYTVDLDSGRFGRVGTVGNGASVVGLAVVDDGTGYALTTDGRLLRFDPTDPGSIADEQTITGLVSGDALVGIDVRPATGELVALGAASYVYVVDPDTGAASAVGPAFTPPLEGSAFGFDFNPTVDRIRVVSDTGQNLRLNPDTGLIGSNPDTGAPTIDGRLAYAAGDANAGAAPSAVGAGYTNNVDGAESTVLYVVDAAQDVLTTQDPPNDGVLNTVGDLGVDASGLVGFDIAPSGAAYATISTAPTLPNTGTGAVASPVGSGLASLAAALAAAALVAGWSVRTRRA